MVRVQHDQPILMREEGQCRKCVCMNGNFMCSPPDDSEVMCTLSDPPEGQAPMNCMKDGEMVMHGEQREVRM